MIIFSIPKEFVDGHISLIQDRAIRSWVVLGVGDVFLMGKDKGVPEKAQEYGVKNITDIKYNEKGTPFVSSAFKKIQEVADDDIYMFTNADMVFDESLKNTIKKLPRDKKFLVVGRRIDIETEDLDDAGLLRFARNDGGMTDDGRNDAGLRRDLGADFVSAKGGNKIRPQIARNDERLVGKLHSPAGIDYFIFSKGLFTDMPDLLVGRIGWDNWMIYHAIQSGYMVIDATNAINAYHQNHDYPNYNKGIERKTNPEALKNIEVLGGKNKTYTTEDANWKFDEDGRLVRNWRRWIVRAKRFLR